MSKPATHVKQRGLKCAPSIHQVNGGSVELWKGTSGSTWLYEGPQLRHWLEGM